MVCFEYQAFSSTYLGGLLNAHLPEVTEAEARKLSDEDLLVIATQDPADLPEAQRRLQTCGLYPSVLKNFEIPHPAGTFYLHALGIQVGRSLTVQPDGSACWRLVLLKNSDDTPFLQHFFQACGASTRITENPENGSLLIHSSEPADAEVASFGPFSIPQEGRYAFLFRYAVQSGKINIRIRDANCKDLEIISSLRSARSATVFRRIEADLQKGVPIRIVIKNDAKRHPPLVLTLLELEGRLN